MTKKQRNVLFIPIVLFTVMTVFLLFSPDVNLNRTYNNDELIREQANGSSTNGYIGHSDGSASIQSFRGIKTLLLLHVEKENTTFEYDCNINLESGSFKIVLVTENGEVTTLAENNSISQTITLPEGDHRIKMVGKNANVEFAFSPIHSTETITIEKIKF